MILEILSPRFQNMLKLGDLLSGKHALERKPMVWLENFGLLPEHIRRSEYSPMAISAQLVGIVSQSEGSLVRFSVGAHAWFAGLVLSWGT